MFTQLFISLCSLIPLPSEIDWAYGELNAPFNSPLVGIKSYDQRIRAYQALYYVGMKEQILDYYWERQSSQSGLAAANDQWLNEFADFLRVMYLELKDCPKIEEAVWLPSYYHACEMLKYNRKVSDYLDSISWYYSEQSNVILNIKKQNDYYYNLWSQVSSAQYDLDMIYRRKAMYQLKIILNIKHMNEFCVQEFYPNKLFQIQPDLSGK